MNQRYLLGSLKGTDKKLRKFFIKMQEQGNPIDETDIIILTGGYWRNFEDFSWRARILKEKIKRYKATYLILDNDSKFLKEVFNTKFNWKKEKFLEEDVLVENVYPHIKYLIKRNYNFDNFI